MKAKFISSDFGALVLGREVLKNDPQADLEFFVKGAESKDSFGESDLWEIALEKILTEHTRFGRIGIFFCRCNSQFKKFLEKNLSSCAKKYKKPVDRRAEKTPQFHSFSTQVVRKMANEDWADTVEFRRIMRKYLRKAKHAHCDTIFFPEAIFGEEKTKKILQHLAGTQMKVFTPNDFLLDHPEFNKKKTATKQKITIKTKDDPEFTNLRAEKILRTKLKK